MTSSPFVIFKKYCGTKNCIHILLYVYIFLALLGSLFVSKKIINKESETISLQKEILLSDIHLELRAQSFVIYDLATRSVVLSRNEKEVLPLASLSKIISLAAYLDFKKENGQEINTETQKVIEQILVESDNQGLEDLGKSFEDKNKVSILSLIETNLLPKLGITDIRMQNLTGLDLDEKNPSNVSSSQSLALVFAYFYTNYREVFQDTKFSSINGLQNTNKQSDKTYGLLASKTGFTDLAGGNLAVAVSPSPGKEYIIVVMGSTKEERFNDVEKLNNTLPFLSKIKHEK